MTNPITPSTAPSSVWEIVDNDFVDVACAEHAHDFLVERGVKDHTIGEDYYSDPEIGIYATEDVFGEHAGNAYRCIDPDCDVVFD